MPNRSPRRRQAGAVPGGSRNASRRSNATPAPGHRRVTPLPHSRASHVGVLTRPFSEPALWTMGFDSDGIDVRDDDDVVPRALQILPRHYTCTDICHPAPGLVLSPSPPRSMEGSGGGDRKWEGKVLVTVTVEGSPGPVRAMVRLGARVEEAIGAVVDAYGREGRSPKLEPSAVASFQLHHNHFCLQSLNKADTLGQVGGRSFYLRRNGGGGASLRGASGGGEEGDAAVPVGGRRVQSDAGSPGPLVLLPTHRFLSAVVGRVSKIGRRLRKLWRALGCATCG